MNSRTGNHRGHRENKRVFFLVCSSLCPLWLSFAGCSGTDTAPPPPREIVIDRDDIDIHESVKVKPGVYHVPDLNGDGVLRVQGMNLTVDLTGVTIVGSKEGALPDSFEGIAVRVVMSAEVTVKGGTLRGFRGGVYLQESTSCAVEGVDVSDNRAQRLKSTPSRCDDGADWLAPHFNDENEWWTNHGAGIYLDRCGHCTVKGCTGRRTQNGIALRSTHDTVVIDNDMSWMSGWGIAMWRSSKNEISHNRCDYGVRGYSFGRYDRGQDSSGILMFEQCSDNVIAYNSATHGGDGIFMYAGHETTQRTGEGGCNRNLLYRNDFSHAVANAIECTFSDENRFIENILDDSNYGVWAGYSYNTEIAGNLCRGERIAGVAIEHGHENRIEGNLFEDCRIGVELWWNENADFMKGPYGQKQNCRSEDYDISLNTFTRCPLGLRIGSTARASVNSNEFSKCSRLADLAGPCPDFDFTMNRILGESPGWFRNDTGARLEIGPCWWEKGQPASTDDLACSLGPDTLKLDLGKVRGRTAEPGLQGTMHATLVDLAGPGPFVAGKSTDPRAQGMNAIVVDEWGPCDPSVPKIFPTRQCAWNEAEIFLFGTEKHIGLQAENASAELKGRTIVVKPDNDKPGAHPFTLNLVIPGLGKLTATGTILVASWDVEFRAWNPGEGEHGGYAKRLDDAHWNKLMAEPALVKATLPALQRPWENLKVPHDHFTTRATATMTLPAGKWRLTTVSDDGVRVLVDGKKVIDNWTWHGPAPDEAVVTLADGAHEIVVEHFEIDGAEALEFTLEPVE